MTALHCYNILTMWTQMSCSAYPMLYQLSMDYISKTALLGYRHYRPHDLCTGLYSLYRLINSVQLCKFLTTDTIATPLLHFWLHFFVQFNYTFLLHFYYAFLNTFTTLLTTLLLHFWLHFYYTFTTLFCTLLLHFGVHLLAQSWLCHLT